MKKTYTILLLLTMLFSCNIMLKAQDYLPFVNDNYAGISGIHLQPASIADSRYKVDVTLMGLSLSTYNNYIYLDRDYLSDFNLIGTEGFDVRENLLKNITGDGKDKFFYQDMRFDIMNFMITINPRLAVGFSASVREVFNIDNISEPYADFLYYGSSNYFEYGKLFHGNDIRVNTSAWAEYGITLAGVLFKSDHHMIKGGMTIKLIEGLGSAYANAENVNFQIHSIDSVGIYNTHINYGISENIGNGIENGMETIGIGGRYGMGFDFGIVWEWRPNYSDHLYDMDGETNLERRDENKYKLRVGLSVKDLGAVKYRKWNQSQDFVINGDFSTVMLENVQSLEEINNLLHENPDIVTFTESGSAYRMSLPTAISLQVDYNIYKDFYINVTPYLALKQGNTKYTKVHSFNSISIAPRYETTWFGISIPMQYNQISGFNLGTGLRLGPIWVGSNNMFSTLFKQKVQDLNVQMMVKLPIPHLRVKDRDGDGVSDKRDECKDVYGVLKKNGCPEDDHDGDGVPDEIDRCPDTAGKAELEGCPDMDNDGIADVDDECPEIPGLAMFKGCPDSDNDNIADHLDKCPDVKGLAQFEGCPDSDGDGIQDSEDECPELAGLAMFNGCPDFDNDSIPDHLDKCPTVKGYIEYEGCPDTDGDNIPDHEDNCPYEAGLPENNGCPDIDTDGDGIKDADDECPYLAGPKEFNGCPDSDGDGVRDLNDECPNIAGPIEFNGCPDSDNDSIPDQLDKCPMIKGLAQFDGCPDTDGDGIQDSEDECPEEPGLPENNGCPVYEKVEFATNISFQSGKAILTQESYPYLDQLVQLLNDNPNCWVKLDGHTDSTGSDAVNNKLSQKRVDSIRDYLIEKGINPNRIVAKGHGSSKPIAPNDTAEGRALNRRVEINLAH